jgi:pimeloyl-ACP methyl ester carboxylesterase
MRATSQTAGVPIATGSRRHLLALVGATSMIALLSPSLATAARPAASEAPPQTLKVGTQTLTLCKGTKALAYCGSLSVPLDYSAPEGPHISIGFSFYPATAPSGGHAKGTVVPVEGGPGYPSGESVDYEFAGGEAGYMPMYGQLLQRFNLLAVDNRGTGRSHVLSCKPLQQFSGLTGTSAFQTTVAECAAKLNHMWRYPNGEYVHASDMFNSAPAAEDMAAVVKALGLGKIDLYGDSYGSFFAQVFADRYPKLLRSVILDSTYETVDLDPWYRTSIQSMPVAFQKACERSPACAAASSGPAWGLIEELAASLRAHPISGKVPGAEGKRENVTMDVVGLVNVVSDAAEDTQIYRDLDAAARALLSEGDAAPLLRLYAQRLAVDEAYFGLPTSEYSVELYLADACLDYPQLFELGADRTTKEAQLAAAEALLPASTFSPFSTAEWLAQDENTEALTACIGWPTTTQKAQAPIATPPPFLPSTVPVLVLGGELDTWTPAAGVPTVLQDMGGDSRFIELANATHVVGEQDTVCGSTLVQEFVADPADIQTMDGSCAAAVPAIHAVGVYPAGLAAEQPLQAAPGSLASPQMLQLAAAAVQTAGDAIARHEALEVSTDAGLHGGSVVSSQKKGTTTLTLERDQLVPGVAVSGTVKLTPAPIADDGQDAVATLTVPAANGLGKATFTATWTTAGTDASAHVAGKVAAALVNGTMPAP